MKLELIDDVKNYFRFLSVQLGYVGAAVTAFLIAAPDAALYVWNMLPAELKASIPERYVPLIGVAIFVMGLIARAFKQSKLAQRGNDNVSGPE